MGYSAFLEATIEARIATLKLGFLTTLNAVSYPLNPVPADGATVNPAAMWVYEGTYTTQVGGQNAGYEYNFEIVGTEKFKFLSGDYTRRLSYFGPRIEYASRLYRKPQLDVFPGTATAGDLIQLTICPDPNLSPLTVPASLGGPLQNGTDVPLFPQQFHMALVEYVVMNSGDAMDKSNQVDRAEKRWQAYIDAALTAGGVDDGGEPMMLVDSWLPPIVRDGNG
jgi:hypothetical protein